jgi:hypothetical protein
MTAAEMQAIADRYDARFHNLGEVSIPPVCYEPRFFDLLEIALDKDAALDWKSIEAEFGPIGREEVEA